MLRWILVSGWLTGSLLALHNRLGAAERVQRAQLVSRRVEHHFKILGVEWITAVREAPAAPAACAVVSFDPAREAQTP